MIRGLIVVLLLARTALAQPIAAVAKPLPDPSLPASTLAVRVVAGGPAAPVAGVVVTVSAGGKSRTATTDDTGRARFEGIAAGAKITVSVKSAAPDLGRAVFEMPASGGVRVLLSTASWGSATSLPKPRDFSGRVHPDGAPGSFAVRVSYNDLADPKPPAGVAVTLVGYAADLKVSVASRNTDATGTATFGSLDTSGLTSYFAFAQLPRGARMDRLVSEAATLDAAAGARVVLSSHARTSTEPAIDLDSKSIARGKVRVEIEGLPDPAAAIEIVDAATTKVIASGIAKAGEQFVELAVKPAAGQVIYARTSARGDTYRSRPILQLADRGAVLSIIALPRAIMTFNLLGAFETGVFNVQIRLTVSNNSWIPAPKGRVLALPAGFTAAVLADASANIAKLTSTGIELTAPVPPGGASVIAGFTLPIKNGKARVAMDLPEGTFDSSIRIDDEPGVALELPASVAPPTRDGQYLTVEKIAIKPKQSIVFSVTAPPVDPKQVATAKACASLAPNKRSPLVGKPMIDFTAPTLDGTSFTLSSLRGKQLIVTFNASWNRLHEDQATLPRLALAKGTEVVVVLSDAGAAEVTKAFGKIPFRVVLDAPKGQDALGPITGKWNITAVPETYIVDRKGIVRAHVVNERDWSVKDVPGCLRALE